MNAKEKMLAGLPFDTHDADLGREREKATRLLQKLNTITLFDGRLTGRFYGSYCPIPPPNA